MVDSFAYILVDLTRLKRRVKRLPKQGICPHHLVAELDAIVKRYEVLRMPDKDGYVTLPKFQK